MLYNTEIALNAIGVAPPKGKPAPKDTFCCCCSRPIPAGAEYLPFKASDAFMSHAFFAANSGVFCPFCAGCFDTRTIKKLGACNCIVFTNNGAYPITKNEHRKHFLLSPPNPPFVVTASATTNYQHCVWKAPITLSLDVIYVSWPDKTLTIRHPTLLQAVEVAQRIGQIMTENNGLKGKKAKVVHHPFCSLDRNLKDIRHGQIRHDALALAVENDEVRNGVNFLSNLSLGETWALSTLLVATPIEATHPGMFPLLPNNILQ